MNALSYNTERAHLYIPEYGRNIQNMINYAKQLKTKEERNKAAHAIIDVMGQINPHLRDIEDYNHKLWTHLFVMSNFEIDVDSPYEIPKLEKLKERPQIMNYPTNKSKYGHFGYYTEKMIQEATKIEDKEERENLTEVLANLLKKNYLTFHTPNVEDAAILSHLEELSDGKLVVTDSNILNPTKAILQQIPSQKNPIKRKFKSKKRRK